MSTNSNPHGHEAIQVAVSLWDSRDEDGRLRDLEPHEEAFLSAVHDARNRLDDESCEAALNAALEAYRAFDPDADDEVEIGRAAKMTTIDEIYSAINPMPAMLSAKGKVKPEASLWIEANAHVSLCLAWKKVGGLNDWDSKYFTGDTADEVIAGALSFINALPDAKTAKLHDFMGQLGKVIDAGRDLGIDVDYLNPLTDTMKRLSENIITHQPAEAA